MAESQQPANYAKSTECPCCDEPITFNDVLMMTRDEGDTYMATGLCRDCIKAKCHIKPVTS